MLGVPTWHITFCNKFCFVINTQLLEKGPVEWFFLNKKIKKRITRRADLNSGKSGFPKTYRAGMQTRHGTFTHEHTGGRSSGHKETRALWIIYFKLSTRQLLNWHVLEAGERGTDGGLSTATPDGTCLLPPSSIRNPPIKHAAVKSPRGHLGRSLVNLVHGGARLF